MDTREAGELFDKIVSLYKQQVWFPEDRAWYYPLLAAVTLATHHAKHAHTWPIIDIEGPTASGKGQVVSLLQRLSWRAREVTVVPTIAQLYRYAHVRKGEEPRLVIFDDMRVKSNNPDVRAILNAGVERGKVVPRTIGGREEKFRPHGFKVMAHEEPLPRSYQSLRRRCIRITTSRNDGFVPELPRPRDVKRAAARLAPELERWRRETNVRPLVRRWLLNQGRVKLLAEERPAWHLVLAVAAHCSRLGEIIPALEAHRAGGEVTVTHWWRERALPVLRTIDPAGKKASELHDELRKRLGADVPISEDQLGRRLVEAIDDSQLPWRHRVLHGGRVYERRQSLITEKIISPFARALKKVRR